MRLDLRLLLLLAASNLLMVSPVFGQYPRDNAANKKIDEALNVHYLATDFQKAEDVLLGTVKACEDQCKSSTIGRAWMYVGVVRGSGNKDQAGAKEAFELALKADPAVALDAALATPETKATFEALGGQSTVPEAAEAGEAAPAPVAAAGVGLDCTPGVRSVQTRRPIPVSCRGDGEATHMSLRYKEYAAEDWKTINMSKLDGSFQGEIPCDVTHTAGPLSYFVVATDAAGDPVDTFGSKGAPKIVTLEANAGEAPPAFPGKAPPERCPAKEICPPDFPGCGGGEVGVNRGNKEWGASCDQSAECASGLLCIDGSCETAPSCVVDADCETGVCRAGKCDIKAKEGLEADAAYQKNFWGLHFAVDTGFVGGDNVCRALPEEYPDAGDYECFLDGERYPGTVAASDAPTGAVGDAYPGAGIGDGLTMGTLRLLASYDRALSPNFTLGARAGFAFRGAPDGFLPVHAEARAAYWFTGVSSGSVRGYVHMMGGLAQVDLKAEVVAYDCTNEEPWDQFLDCANARDDYDSSEPRDLESVNLDAYKRLGRGFAGAGAGAVFMIGDSAGVQLNLNLMYTLTDSGLVIQPSFGGMFAF